MYQELLPTRQDGESRVREVRGHADKILPQTAPQGQKQVRRELDSLKYDWDKYSSRITETKSALESAHNSWEQFDSLYDDLGKWLKEMEVKIKDHELKSTLQDKKTQVDKFKVRMLRNFCVSFV